MTVDKPHTLVIEDIEGDKEWRIVHPPTCPWEGWRCSCADPIFGPEPLEPGHPHMHFHRTCLTVWEVNNNGLDGLGVDLLADYIDRDYVPATRWESDWRKLRPGRYTIEATYSWSGSWYDEVDSEFYVVEEIAS